MDTNPFATGVFYEILSIYVSGAAFELLVYLLYQ